MMWLIQSPTTMWLIQQSHYDMAKSKSHYDVANSMSYYDMTNSKSHYDVANSMSHNEVANSKPATLRHFLQSPLLYDISKARYDPALLKARCYTASFTKLVATRQYFTKSQNHFDKAQILI